MIFKEDFFCGEHVVFWWAQPIVTKNCVLQRLDVKIIFFACVLSPAFNWSPHLSEFSMKGLEAFPSINESQNRAFISTAGDHYTLLWFLHQQNPSGPISSTSERGCGIAALPLSLLILPQIPTIFFLLLTFDWMIPFAHHCLFAFFPVHLGIWSITCSTKTIHKGKNIFGYFFMWLTDRYRFAHGERVIDAISIFEEAADLSLTFVYILKVLFKSQFLFSVYNFGKKFK